MWPVKNGDVKVLPIDRAKIDQIVNAKTTAEAWIAIRSSLLVYGFDHILYGTNRLRGNAVFGQRSNSFFLSDLPEAFMEPFWENELYRTAPVAIWAMQNEGPMSFDYGSSRYKAGQLSPQQHDTQERLRDAGVTSGYVIGFNPPKTMIATAISLINFGMPQEAADDIWNQHGAEIQTYASVFNLKMATLPIPPAKSGLTKRQKEVLHWVAHGKTTAEVATILGLSGATIEKHLRQARDTLGVSTTTQAVLHAQINAHIFTAPDDEMQTGES